MCPWWPRWCVLLLSVILVVTPVLGQNQLVNGGMIVVGPINGCDATGSPNAYVCTFDPAITEYNANVTYIFSANAANTGPATLNINGVGATPITKMTGGITTALIANDIRAGQRVMVIYDGTNMQMVSQLGNAATGTGDFSSNTATSVDGEAVLFSGTSGKTGKRATGTGVAHLTAGVLGASPVALATEVAGDLLYANLTPPSTASLLLGRGNTTGDWQEILLGTNLAMAGNTLNATGGTGGLPADTALRAVFYDTATTGDGAPGLTFATGGGSIATVANRRTARSATGTLDTTDGPVVECSAPSANVTLTLPSTAGTQTWLHILKDDNTAFTCTIQAAAGQALNGVTAGTLTLTNQWEAADLYVSDTATPNWHGISSTTNMRRSIYIPAGSMDVSGACALGASATLVTNGPKLPAITCTDADADGVEFDAAMPDGWDGGTITVELIGFYLNTTHAGAPTVDFNISGQCVSHGDVVAAHAITSGATAESATNVDAVFTASAVANRRLEATVTPLTLAGTCLPGDHVFLHALVDATSTTFTPMTDFRLLGAKIEYTRSAHD